MTIRPRSAPRIMRAAVVRISPIVTLALSSISMSLPGISQQAAAMASHEVLGMVPMRKWEIETPDSAQIILWASSLPDISSEKMPTFTP